MSWAGSNFAIYSTEFSPFRDDLLLAGAAQYYGIVGNGKAVVFQKNPQTGEWLPAAEWLTQDGVYDTAWSEASENVFATAQGDGTLKLFDVTKAGAPVVATRPHQQEVYGVDWNSNLRELICTASWDSTNLVFDAIKGTELRRYSAINFVTLLSIA